MIRIELPLAPTRGPASVNVYLLTGEPLTLVDTGPRTEAAWAALEAGLAAHGYHLADLEQLVITHAHVDHYGQAARIVATLTAHRLERAGYPQSGSQARPRTSDGRPEDGASSRNRDLLMVAEPIEVLAHAETALRLNNDAAFSERAWAFLFDTVRQAGAPAEPLARRLAAMRREESWAEPVQVTRTLAEGEFVTRGREAWQVICLPGHAPGLIGLYQPETAELILSDHLLPDIQSAPGVYAPGAEGRSRHPYMTDYVASLRRVAALPVRTAWPGHGEPFTDVPGPAERRLDEVRQQCSALTALLAGGDKTAYQLWQALFPHLLPLDPLNGTIQIISHLDWLEAEGQVQAYEREGRLYYRLP